MTLRVLSPEIETVYVDAEHHEFVVSLVLGLPQSDRIQSADDALQMVLCDVYQGDGAADHIWCVWQRSTGDRELRQVSDVLGPLREGWVVAIDCEAFEEVQSAFESALRGALESTAGYVDVRGAQDGVQALFVDEPVLTAAETATLSLRSRLEHVARLLRTIAATYGMALEGAGGDACPPHRSPTIREMANQMIDLARELRTGASGSPT